VTWVEHKAYTKRWPRKNNYLKKSSTFHNT
jgi:hypothetical protein